MPHNAGKATPPLTTSPFAVLNKNKYSNTHAKPKGSGDNRPTALRIIKDEPREGDLNDKMVFITGCSSGLGVETVRAMKATGATLFVTARNLEKAWLALGDILYGGHIHLLQLDLESFESIRACVADFKPRAIERRFGINDLHAWSARPGGIRAGLQRPSLSDYTTVFISGIMVTFNIMMSTEQGTSTSIWAAVSRDLEGQGGKYLERNQISEPVKKEFKPIDPGHAEWAYYEDKAKRLYDESLKLGLVNGVSFMSNMLYQQRLKRANHIQPKEHLGITWVIASHCLSCGFFLYYVCLHLHILSPCTAEITQQPSDKLQDGVYHNAVRQKPQYQSPVKHLSSYNWIEAPQPTIAVPGSPELWFPSSAPQQVPKDSGLIYSAQNTARHPDSPLKSLFRSLHITHPSFDIRSVDLVTDRRNIRKLLSYINPNLGRNGRESLTINVEIIRSAAVFCRSETEPSPSIGAHEFIGFRHEFEKAYTSNQNLSYKLSNLQLVIRYETNGYIDDALTRRTGVNNDNLAASVKDMLLAPTPPPAAAHAAAGSKLMIKKEAKEAKEVPIESYRNQNTRDVEAYRHTKDSPATMDISNSQTWLFEVPKFEIVALEIQSWEKNHRADLNKLVASIKSIIQAVMENGGKVDVIYDDQHGDELVI
ncbi:short-chain dehydrogenase, putative [Talaromyces stipitatus ATCC 10500]|uniref:Short-chain dehydrogenase, putative n=1 Tax=Talaromyces stipitatus (strain ATCC 10500 / CBS 375.48 / QM 6759 / NRRL 1006) TaxID=441959 RepID=B8M366_TALSN|nr:short-chain dehydrogenase, putative [Talaromyces stipitatus ATCC 10500]EED22042.1 short-chain dehydrogenase, putative [Talaromyces stipitatus ATCC 10500]